MSLFNTLFQLKSIGIPRKITENSREEGKYQTKLEFLDVHDGVYSESLPQCMKFTDLLYKVCSQPIFHRYCSLPQ